MARRATTKETIKKNTIKDMKTLGVYKEEYVTLIDIYSGLCEQYFSLLKRFEKSGFEVEIDCGFGESKKTNPIVRVLETLRKDILQYSDRLKLNPKSYDEKENPKKSKGILVETLKNLE